MSEKDDAIDNARLGFEMFKEGFLAGYLYGRSGAHGTKEQIWKKINVACTNTFLEMFKTNLEEREEKAKNV